MPGYRQHGFDPGHWEPQGPPLKPYNWVQWTGVGMVSLGGVAYLALIADKLGWIHIGFHDVAGFVTLPMMGVLLINSRREELPEEKRDEYREKLRRRTYIALAVALVAAAIGFALAIYSHSHGA